MIDGAAEYGRQRIIYGEGEAVSMSNISYSGDVDKVELGVTQRLSVDELGIGLDSCLEVLRILGIDEGSVIPRRGSVTLKRLYVPP